MLAPIVWAIWLFDVVFVKQLFSDVNRQLEMNVFYLLDLQDSYPHNGTSEAIFVHSDLKLIPY